MEKKNTPFRDSALPMEKRLDWLLSEMTMEEKLSCLSSGMKPRGGAFCFVLWRGGGSRRGGQE